MSRFHAVFFELPLRDIRPRGWIRRALEKQRDGLTGNVHVAGHPFNTPGWAAPRVNTPGVEGWWPYEQTGYWIDGAMRCGHLVDDDFLIDKATTQVEYVLDHADKDGYLGPHILKAPRPPYRWGHAVFFRALMAHESATGDDRIVAAIRDHYLSGTAPHSGDRDVCNVESILWAYGRTGDQRLLDHALEAYTEYNRISPDADTSMRRLLSSRRATEHGVTFNEIGKLGTILYMHTGKKRYLDASRNGSRKMDRDQVLIDGVPSSSEHLRGKDPLDSHETCDISDYSWNMGYLLLATGDGGYADRIEKAIFNGAFGAVRSDWKALQYFSCPNQVIADRHSNHNLFRRGSEWMSYRPRPGTACCTGEMHRMLPNYASRMWLGRGKDGIVAALYGPSQISFPVGGRRVTIVEETDYPFSDRIEFRIRTRKPAAFTLHLRIPGWCEKARVEVNGRKVPKRVAPGTFVPVRRTFKNGDRVILRLPMEIRTSRWPKGGMGIERGPLVYALRIREDWRVDTQDRRSTKAFPAWNLYPASPWNYALVGEVSDVIEKKASDDPWSIEKAPIELKVPARRVRGWDLVTERSIAHEGYRAGRIRMLRREGRFRFTPPLPDRKGLRGRLAREVEEVTLVPYGCTHLRIAVFPHHCPQRGTSRR